MVWYLDYYSTDGEADKPPTEPTRQKRSIENTRSPLRDTSLIPKKYRTTEDDRELDQNPIKPGRNLKGKPSANLDPQQFPFCNGCGRNHPNPRGVGRCFFVNHPDYVATGNWMESTVGKAYIALHAKNAATPQCLQHNFKLNAAKDSLVEHKRDTTN
jgi:hypothetical protein